MVQDFFYLTLFAGAVLSAFAGNFAVRSTFAVYSAFAGLLCIVMSLDKLALAVFAAHSVLASLAVFAVLAGAFCLVASVAFACLFASLAVFAVLAVLAVLAGAFGLVASVAFAVMSIYSRHAESYYCENCQNYG